MVTHEKILDKKLYINNTVKTLILLFYGLVLAVQNAQNVAVCIITVQKRLNNGPVLCFTLYSWQDSTDTFTTAQAAYIMLI